ncbi:undecaprenyl-diphosphate phosphatase [Micropruina sonneratiae]|uniref:undecaprenyl-diphosphate phosphatase n=1 Tax=Micropruina sonneratiae TaxID=2986940 RepID=UPI0022280654|nr:undecaprenyl-diphosphate phosphatase [Micropruina sp. KQZ13P-5]MCW3159617.1 undecaprenyl-diphosphate phosphatase [Micropruina sp. KQZ13P-5]
MNWWQSIVLGIVEGITEFLPISSTGHLTVTEKLMGLPIDDASVTAYTAIIQVGAMIASIIYFWSDIVRFATAWFAGLRDAGKRNADYRMGWAIIAGFAVTAVIALLAEPLITGPLRSLWAVVAGLVGWSIVMFVGDRLGKQTRGEDSITVRDGIILGALQSLALVPGVSRSGATITTGLLLGLDRVSATRMSFFLGIPTLVASGLYQAVKEAKHIADGVGWASTAIGTVVSGVVAYASIAWLLRYVSKNNFTGFIIYRIALAIVIVVLLATQVISAT